MPSRPTCPFRRCMLLAALLGAAVAVPAQARSDQGAYVATETGGVFQYGIGAAGGLAALSPPSVATSGAAQDVAVSSDGFSVYVAGETSIDQYDLLTDGTLGPKNPPSVAAPAGAVSIVVSPDHTSVYAAGDNTPAVLQYSVSVAGSTLVPKARPSVPLPAGTKAGGVAISPDGRSVYASFVTNSANTPASIAQFDVGAGGALTPKNPAIVAAGTGPAGAVVVSADGQSVYMANLGSDTVSQYDVGAGGRLTPKSVSAVGTNADQPADIALTPDGASAYVANLGDPGAPGSGAVTQYTVNSDGSLALERPSTVPAAGHPTSITVSADSASVYVTSDDAVLQYSVGASGRLAAKSTPSVPSGAQTRGIALAPLVASAGDDVLYGTAGADVIRGKGGNDVIRGLRGDDVLIGGRGGDRLIGGPGRDVMRGGPGRDVIDARDGERDRVRCGAGRDVVLADPADRARGCERVIRAAVR
ncbi:MAG: beta-propeller fold lactonase family protein [Thermoleophilia bacterium]